MNIREKLEKEFLLPLGIDIEELSRLIEKPIIEVNLMMAGKKKIDSSIALKLSILFNTTVDYWLE